MLVESKISQGVQQNADLRTRKKTLTSTNPVLVNPQKKDVFFGQNPPQSSNKAEDKKKGWDKTKIFNTSANMFALAAYTILVGSAALSMKNKAPIYKVGESFEKHGKTLQSDLNKVGQILDDKPRPLFLKISDKFGELKTNSEELTTNMVYAFGTLVVMPFVIMFSPLGKKDATKEDRIFTVFRQPLSFATTYGAQVTVEKLIKTAIPEMQKYGLISRDKAIKDKNGNVLEFDAKKPQGILKAKISEWQKKFTPEELAKKKQDVIDALRTEQKALETKINNGVNILKSDEIDNVSRNTLLKEDLKILDPRDAQGNRPVGPDGKLNEGKSITDFIFDKVKGSNDGAEKLHYQAIMDKAGMSELKDAAHESFVVQRRNLASKNMGQVFINSTVSQAISLIALTFIYGKMMKGIMGYKKSMEDNGVKKYKEQENKNAEKGGVQ